MLNDDKDQAAQVSKTLRKLGHDTKGPLINVKMGLEIIAQLDADAQVSVTDEMISTLNELQGLLEESFLFAQLPYLDREPLSLVSVVREFEQGALWPVNVEANEGPRVAVDAQRLVKMLHWWQRLQSTNQAISIVVSGATIGLTWNPAADTPNNERFLLFARAFANNLGGTFESGESTLRLQLATAEVNG